MTTGIKIIHWLPRILCILAIMFVSLFALDSFEPGMPLWKQVGGFFIHLIPTFVLILFLIVAWKWELISVHPYWGTLCSEPLPEKEKPVLNKE